VRATLERELRDVGLADDHRTGRAQARHLGAQCDKDVQHRVPVGDARQAGVQRLQRTQRPGAERSGQRRTQLVVCPDDRVAAGPRGAAASAATEPMRSTSRGLVSMPARLRTA
jgi:hypothetical protein